MNDDNEQPLSTIFESDEKFSEALYQNPRGVISKVAEGIEANLTAKYQQSRQHEDIAANQEKNWSRFWAENSQISRADRPEVRRHLMELIQGADSDLASYQGDPSGAFEMMSDRAERHLRELSKQRKEDEELSVFVGGPGDEDAVDPADLRQGSSLTSMIKSRREAKRSRGRAA